MELKRILNLKSSRRAWIILTIAVLVSAALVVTTQAAGENSTVESELGEVKGPIAQVDSGTASGKSAIRFGAAEAPPAPTPPTSGSGNGQWSSGAISDNLDDFAAWRGQPLGNTGLWPNRASWGEVQNPDIYGNLSKLSKYEAVWVAAAMLPEDGSGNFAACAKGEYDGYFKTYGETVKKAGRDKPTTYIRLGWEANGNWYDWSIGDDVEAYKACFVKEAQAITSAAPNVQIEWNMNKDSHMSRSVADAYPGNNVVDVVGVDFYDMWPAYPDKAAWDEDYMATQNGGPRGIGSWLAFAKANGKKISFAEWGINRDGGGGGDHPYYIEAMHNFFKTNSADIAYETYFNTLDEGFMIFPAGTNPAASAKYRELWSAGQ